MGWRDRDYARWTDEERRRFLGSNLSASSSSRSYTPHREGFRIGVVQGAFLAISVSALLFLVGHVPGSHPLVPALDFRLPFPSSTGRGATRPARAAPRRIVLRGSSMLK